MNELNGDQTHLIATWHIIQERIGRFMEHTFQEMSGNDKYIFHK